MTWLPRSRKFSTDSFEMLPTVLPPNGSQESENRLPESPFVKVPFSLTDMTKWVSLISLKTLLNLNEIHTIERVAARSREDG